MSTAYLSKRGMQELIAKIGKLEDEELDIQERLREVGRVVSREDRLTRAELLVQQETVLERLVEARTLARTARLLPSKGDRLRVALGSVVDMVDQKGQLVRFMVVDSLEANPMDGRISINSPLGQNLLGRQLKETVSWPTSAGVRTLQLVKVR